MKSVLKSVLLCLSLLIFSPLHITAQPIQGGTCADCEAAGGTCYCCDPADCNCEATGGDDCDVPPYIGHTFYCDQDPEQGEAAVEAQCSADLGIPLNGLNGILFLGVICSIYLFKFKP